MPIHNTDVAKTFNKVADLLEIDGASPFRVRAYRQAARTVEGLGRSVAEMVKSDEDLTELPGIGKDLAGKIEEIVESGKLKQLDDLEKQVPAGLSQLLDLPGLGPKRVKAIYDELGVRSLDDLEKAAKAGKLRDLEGLGEKTEKKILDELRKHQGGEKRERLVDVQPIVDDLVGYLRKSKGIKQVVVAGSFRRRKETVGDLDVLVAAGRGSNVMERFVKYEDVDDVVSKGSTRSTVRLRSGLQVDVRVVAEVSFGAALHYFTGSKAHNIAIRKMGVKKKLKINEYGVFKGDDRVAGRKEEEVFEQVGLPYIEPEMREDRGEIEAAQKGKLPELITLNDIRGDLHAHTEATDGRATLREMAEAARDLGYDYLAITDHSKRLTVAQGLDAKRLRKQIGEIQRLNDEFDRFRVLSGIEVDILDDGSLDLDDEVLAELDLVVCAVHSKFALSEQKQTERVIRALDNPHVNILSHPTGRMIGQREPFEIDIERVIKAALERGCYLEVNAQPDRLDLGDVNCKLAKDMGLKLVISTDAHSPGQLRYLQYGIDQARRGWLEAGDVINTRSWRDLKKLLRRD